MGLWPGMVEALVLKVTCSTMLPGDRPFPAAPHTDVRRTVFDFEKGIVFTVKLSSLSKN